METVNVQCRVCGEEKQVVVDPQDMKKWKEEGAFIQDALPYLSPADRELLISATCGECFDNMFGPGEDDDESVFEEDEEDDDVYDEDDDEIWEDEDEDADLLDLTQTQQDVMAEICSIVSSFLMNSDPSEEAYAELGEKISLAVDGHSSQFFGNLYDIFHRSGKNK